MSDAGIAGDDVALFNGVFGLVNLKQPVAFLYEHHFAEIVRVERTHPSGLRPVSAYIKKLGLF